MGLYDREYSRGPEPGFHVAAPTTATVQIILVTVGVYILQMFSPSVTEALELKSDWYLRPWEAYRLLTSGFCHSLGGAPDDPGVMHIIANMFGLWLFGRDVEHRYGRRQFIAFYLTAIVVSGLVWSASQFIEGERAVAIGASGGTVAVVVLFALNFPNVDILFMFAIPMKMWVFGVLLVMMDAYGAIKQNGNVAFTAHLGGAAYGFLYYRTRWSPALWLFDSAKSIAPSRKPRLRVHEPDEPDDQDDLSQKVDAILKKIQEKGQDSLTWGERRLLEKASRRYQQKRK